MQLECRLCPRECGVDRISGETGFCKATAKLKVASYHAHFGEERPLMGVGGSGTIFLSHCNLGCVFCQNWDISHLGSGTDCEIADLADMMLQLQATGCQNINIVTPTHFSQHVILALDQAASRGLSIPLVYNTCGWERDEILGLLDGIVDICRGLMIRHLVMPNNVSGSIEAMRWIAGHLPLQTYVNIMNQYRSAYRAHLFPEINVAVSREAYMEVLAEVRNQGLTNH